MPGTLKVGGNIIASHSGVEGAGTVTLGNVVLGDSAVPTNNYTLRNKIINGNFDIWQRSEDLTNGTNAWDYYTADRYQHNKGRSQKITDFVDGKTVNVFQISDEGQGYNGGRGLFQNIEDYRYEKTVTLSAWIKASQASTINFGSVYDFTEQARINDLFWIDVTTSWQKFTRTFKTTVPALGKANQYIIDGLTDGVIYDVAMVQLEEGSVATPFEQRPYGLELSLCQRYYEVMVIPSRGIHGHYSPNGGTSDAAAFHGFFTPFKQTKRITPTIPSVTSNSAWAILSYSNYSAQTNHTFRAQAISTEGFSPVANRVAGNNGPSLGNVYSWQTTVTYHIDAEIY